MQAHYLVSCIVWKSSILEFFQTIYDRFFFKMAAMFLSSSVLVVNPGLGQRGISKLITIRIEKYWSCLTDLAQWLSIDL